MKNNAATRSITRRFIRTITDKPLHFFQQENFFFFWIEKFASALTTSNIFSNFHYLTYYVIVSEQFTWNS